MKTAGYNYKPIINEVISCALPQTIMHVKKEYSLEFLYDLQTDLLRWDSCGIRTMWPT